MLACADPTLVSCLEEGLVLGVASEAGVAVAVVDAVVVVVDAVVVVVVLLEVADDADDSVEEQMCWH